MQISKTQCKINGKRGDLQIGVLVSCWRVECALWTWGGKFFERTLYNHQIMKKRKNKRQRSSKNYKVKFSCLPSKTRKKQCLRRGFLVACCHVWTSTQSNENKCKLANKHVRSFILSFGRRQNVTRSDEF